MEQKVGNVDLDELKKAREALNQELGLETDPNMYSNYNPNRNSEQSGVSGGDSLENSEVEGVAEINSAAVSGQNFNELNPEDNNIDFNGSEKENFDDSSVAYASESIQNVSGESDADTALTDTSGDDSTKNNNEIELNSLPKSNNRLTSTEKDFSVYDNFSDFEIFNEKNEDESKSSQDLELGSEVNEQVNELDDLISATVSENQLEAQDDSENSESKDNLEIDELEKLLSDIDESSTSDEEINSSNEEKQLYDENPDFNEFNEKISETFSLASDFNDQNSVDTKTGEVDLSKSSNEKITTGPFEVEKNIHGDRPDNSEIIKFSNDLSEIAKAGDENEESYNLEKELTKSPEEDVNISLTSHEALDDVGENLNTSVSSNTNYEDEAERAQKNTTNSSENIVVKDNSLSDNDIEQIEGLIDLEEIIPDDMQQKNISEKTATVGDFSANDGENKAANEEFDSAENLGVDDAIENDSENRTEEFEQIEESDENISEIFKEELNFAPSKKFIEAVSDKNFEDAATKCYVLGEFKNGLNSIKNLKDMFNVAVFSKNSEISFALLSQIMLGLAFKSLNQEINFVVCDEDENTKLKVFNDFSFLKNKKVATSESGIYDDLIALSSEIDGRYDKLAKINVKNIEEFNRVLIENDIAPLPYTVLFYNNYNLNGARKSGDDILLLLSKIIRFGRIVGVYVYLATESSILDDKINFNLSTRIGFKQDNEQLSYAQVGDDSLLNLDYDNEFICKSVFNESDRLKLFNISVNEIKLIIKNLDN